MMKRLIIASNNLQAGQQVNKIGRYLYKHIDGAYKIQNTANMCDVYIMTLYQATEEDRKSGYADDNDMHQMNMNINVTTYQNKIRVNVIEISPEERTIGSYVIPPEKLQDLEEAKKLILSKITRSLSKLYQDYDFIF